MNNVKHSPGGGNVQIESHKLEYKEKASPRIGSLDHASYTPGGGNVKVCYRSYPPSETPTNRAKLGCYL